MKKVFLLMILFYSIIYANDTELILNDIKILKEDTNKRFEIMQNSTDKRIENVFGFLYVLIILVLLLPFIIVYLLDKREENNRIQFDKLRDVIFILKKIAEDDKKIEKSLEITNL